MKKMIFGLFFFVSSTAFGVEKLDDCYLVSYGNSDADVKVTSYYSFSCPHCIALFREEFEELKKHCLESDKISFTFHPIPADLLTVQAMVCLSGLSSLKKQIFLEALLAEVDLGDQDYSAYLMVKAMEILGQPVPLLRDREYFLETKAFQDAFKFLKQDEKILEVPTVEVNGHLYQKEIPSKKFIQTFLKP